jgi:predicted nucleotidyltransferase
MANFDFKIAENYLLFKTIAGSKAYGLDLPTSDTDIRGIFMQPNEYRLGNGYVEQLNDDKNDIVYYELNRFVNLLAGNNPNIIENLFAPEDKILHFDQMIKPLYDNRMKFLTKKIRLTFGGYSISQIKKARGLNKKIVNPIDKVKKTPLNFCYIFEKEKGYMMLAEQWLKKHKRKQEFIGLSEMPNGVQLYKVYYDWLAETKNDNPRYADIAPHGFKGIISENGNDIRHSEIPKDFPVEAFLYFNKDGYSAYCKEYKEYWDWVAKRNPVRYNDNVSHKQNYDGKNMMHCLRMLDMAIEVAEGKGVNLVRPNREWLLSVRKGVISYDEIMDLIEEKKTKMDEAFDKSDLPDDVDSNMVHDIIMQIRNY